MNSKFTCEWKGYYKMNKAICIRDFEGVGFLKENNDKDKKVHIKKGDIIEWDNQGCLWYDDVCFGHMDAYPGQYFQF